MTADLSPQAQTILTLVNRQQTGTSMVEIVNALRADGHDTEGDLGMEHPRVPNGYVWAGINRTVVDALNELFTARLVHYYPTTPLVYMVDGAMLRLPIAKRPPSGGYKEPHWIPVVINAGPVPAHLV